MADVVVIKPDQRSANTTQTTGMVRQAGIAPGVCGSQGLWVGFVSAPPGASGVHHHGDAESGIYVLKGRVRMSFGEALENSIIAETGDFIYVPPNTVHVEENLSATEAAELIVARNSAEFMVVNVPQPREGR
jgi:uncharacterized RmlC-like cupin family protein